MRKFEVEDWSSTETKEVQDAILIGLRYKEAYEKLLWEKGVLISCLCSNKTKVIKISKLELNDEGEFINVPVYCVLVAPLDGDTDQTPAVWGMDDGKLIDGYACYSPYSSVQWMLSEMKKWEDENESNK